MKIFLTVVGSKNTFNPFDMPIHKRLAINLLLRVGQKGTPLGSDWVKLDSMGEVFYH